MSDRIGVMDKGCLLQVGTPEEIYEHPASRFVADFIGDINLLEGHVTPGGIRLANGKEIGIAVDRPVGAEVTLALRPERIGIYDLDEVIPDLHVRLPGKVTRRMYYGDAYFYDVDVGLPAPLEVKEENRPDVEVYEMGEEAVVAWDPAASNVVSD